MNNNSEDRINILNKYKNTSKENLSLLLDQHIATMKMMKEMLEQVTRPRKDVDLAKKCNKLKNKVNIMMPKIKNDIKYISVALLNLEIKKRKEVNL